MKLIPGNIVNTGLATTNSLKLPLVINKQVTLDVLRLDKIDPVISGNKWFKLKYYLQEALESGYRQILTFGGPWSNHIVAAACAAKKTGLESIGIIRGEKPTHLSATLQTAAMHGMQLVFISREEYNMIKRDHFEVMDQYPGSYIIPEGGEGENGIKGAAEILALTSQEKYTDIICAMGTGTMLMGIASAATHQRVVGIPVLKGFENWKQNNALLVPAHLIDKITVVDGYHFSGYSKKNSELLEFMNQFYLDTHIPSDFVYTGKLFYSVMDLIRRDFFTPGNAILVIHSGGLQGNLSLPAESLQF
jgi:1-aminocyclopropane-1-carboxylate deaminase